MWSTTGITKFAFTLTLIEKFSVLADVESSQIFVLTVAALTKCDVNHVIFLDTRAPPS